MTLLNPGEGVDHYVPVIPAHRVCMDCRKEFKVAYAGNFLCVKCRGRKGVYTKETVILPRIPKKIERI